MAGSEPGMGFQVPWVGGKVRGWEFCGAGAAEGVAGAVTEGVEGSGPVGIAAGAMVRPPPLEPEGAGAGTAAGGVSGP